VPCTSELK